MHRARLPRAGFSRATVRESEHGFCVKAARKQVVQFERQPVLNSMSGNRLAERYICAFADWSSSQSSAANSWNQNFSNGNQYFNLLKTITCSVRAVRAF